MAPPWRRRLDLCSLRCAFLPQESLPTVISKRRRRWYCSIWAVQNIHTLLLFTVTIGDEIGLAKWDIGGKLAKRLPDDPDHFSELPKALELLSQILQE